MLVGILKIIYKDPGRFVGGNFRKHLGKISEETVVKTSGGVPKESWRKFLEFLAGILEEFLIKSLDGFLMEMEINP